MRVLNLGIIGGGEAVEKAWETIAGSPIIRIETVFCESSELVGLIDDTLRCSQFDDILRNDQIEAIYLATPPFLHVPQALRVLAAGKSILVEKPLGVSMRDIVPLLSFENPQNLTIGLAFKKRFGDIISFLTRELSDCGCVHGSFVWKMPEPITSWRYDQRKAGGGVIMDVGCHVFDLLEYLVGKIIEVEAHVEPCVNFHRIESAAWILLRFLNGVEFQVELDWRVEISLQKIEIETTRARRIVIEKSSEGASIRVVADGAVETIPYDPSSEYLGLFRSFAETIREGRNSLPGLKEGLRNHLVIEAIYKSAETHRPCPVGT